MMSKKKPIIVISIVAVCLLATILINRIVRPARIIVTASADVVVDTLSRPNLNVFLENSGSMDGYMAPGSTLKDAVFSYVSDLEPLCDTISLAYINSKIINRDVDLSTYIKTLTPQAFASAGGNRSNSDICQIIKDVLAQTDGNDVSMLISDFILDLPKESDPTKFLNQVSIEIKSVLANKLKQNPNFSVLILHMESTFTGTYFYPVGNEKLPDAKRPYYIWIFGDRFYLYSIMNEAPFTNIRYGYKNYATYGGETQLSYKAMNVTRTNNILTAKNEAYTFVLDVDFAPTLQPQSIIEDIANYEITSNDDLQITDITPIEKSKGAYTTTLHLSLPVKKIYSNKAVITFTPPAIPVWVDAVNTESADSITSHLDQTTGIKSLVQGVADAYQKHNTTTFNINLKKQ